MVVESICDEESTSFRAVTEHNSFELVDVVDCIPVTKHPIHMEEVSVSDELTETKYLLLFLETVDDKSKTAVIDVRFLLYDNQQHILKQIYENGYCWYSDVEDVPEINNNGLAPDFDCIIVPEKQDISHIMENKNKLNPSFFSELMDISNLIHIFTFGRYRHMSRNRSNQAILSYTTNRAPVSDVKKIDNIKEISNYPSQTVVENICNITFNEQRYAKGIITKVSDLDTFSVYIGTGEYQFTFDGRPETEAHTPTQLYKSFGVGRIANLEGETVYIAPNVHDALYSDEFLGTNKAETFKFKPIV